MSNTQLLEKPIGISDDAGELIAPNDPRFGIVSINPGRVSGTPCFAGTRVPVKHLWDYLEEGLPLEEFLEGFPGVTREQAIGALELAFQSLIAELPVRENCVY